MNSNSLSAYYVQYIILNKCALHVSCNLLYYKAKCLKKKNLISEEYPEASSLPSW